LKKKTLIKLLCIVVAIVLVAGFAYTQFIPKVAPVGSITDALQNAPDGVYYGEYKNGIVLARVEVTIRDHVIVDIEILEHRNGRGQAAEYIVNDVMETQSTDVDVVSGATYSSTTILKAIENALTGKEGE